jgi:hypothetical protein
MEGQAPIYIPQEQGGPVMPQAPGSIFVASYDSQGYSVGIRNRLHTGGPLLMCLGMYISVSGWWVGVEAVNDRTELRDANQ